MKVNDIFLTRKMTAMYLKNVDCTIVDENNLLISAVKEKKMNVIHQTDLFMDIVKGGRTMVKIT